MVLDTSERDTIIMVSDTSDRETIITVTDMSDRNNIRIFRFHRDLNFRSLA